MNLYTQSKDIKATIKKAKKTYPHLIIEKEFKNGHGVIRSENSIIKGDFITYEKTPSDFRASRNLDARIRRLAEKGEGVIYFKKQMHLGDNNEKSTRIRSN